MSTQIKIRDVLIVGLGDSFGSGEGNPSKPAEWRGLRPQLGKTRPNWFTDRKFLRSRAEWIETSCHRSSLNYQTITALKVAAENPHDAVTFVHLACSGAEVFNGLFSPQANKTVSAQLEALETLRCKGRSLKLANQIPIEVPDSSTWKKARGNGAKISRLKICAEPKRRVDLVLLSVGGNDIGFSGLVAWALLPTESPKERWWQHIATDFATGGVVCPTLDSYKVNNDPAPDPRCDPRKVHVAEMYISNLPKIFNALSVAFKLLDINHSTVIHNSYPNPAERSKTTPGDRSTMCPGPRLNKVIDGVRGPIPRTNPKKYKPVYTPGLDAMQGILHIYGAGRDRQIIADQDENFVISRDVTSRLITKLNEIDNKYGFKNISAQNEWTTIKNFHGWCSASHPDAKTEEDELRTWIWGESSEKNLDPYDQSVHRYFRTVNDSLLAQYRGDAIDAIKGTMHPTLSAHLLMAQANYKTAKKIIYGNR